MMVLGVIVVGIVYFFKKNFWWFLEIGCYLLSFMYLWTLINCGQGLLIVGDWFYYDYVSSLLILLTFFVSGLMVTASYTSVLFLKKNIELFSLMVFSMLVFLFLTFSSSDVINFYVFFEASLLPIFLMVMGWGYQPERLQASLYMLFYTLFASLPLLVIILLQREYFSSFLFFNPCSAENFYSPVLLSLIFLFFIFAFLVKLPMFAVHLWLPKAHVEAPVAGSMILAGVLLKLGGYGLWRILSYLFPNFSQAVFIVVMGLIGGVIVSFVCTVQIDMKALVAYSSVVHMGIMLSGLATFMAYGFEGALCMMLGHGLVSSGLFYLVGMNYDRVGSRSLLLNKGLMVLFPAASISWFILSVFNISAPPSLSLLSEILLTTAVTASALSFIIFLMMMNFMSMVYTFYLYAQSQQGKIFDGVLSLSMISVREYAISLIHCLPLSVMVMFFWFFC